MKWMFGRTAMWIWATFAAATVAYAAGAAQFPEGDGKKILEAACTSCHGIDGVAKLKLSKEGWEGMVSSMVANGAQLDQKDFPVLIDYLVNNFGDKPATQQASATPDAAATKKMVEEACSTCHDMGLVSEQKLTKDEWQGVVASMIAKGASLAEKDVPTVVEYLANTYKR